jgi:hypothetical protein
MEIIIEKGRWKKIDEVKISRINLRPYSITEVEKNAEKILSENSRDYSDRTHCNCCGKEWKKGWDIYLAHTDQGKKFICEHCAKKLAGKIGHIPRRVLG